MYLIKNKKGLTLIELVIAFAVLLILLIPALNIIEFCLKNYLIAGQRTQMVRAAEGIMEKIIAQKNYSIQNNSGLTTQRFSEFRYDITVSHFRENKNLREIIVTIYPKNSPEEKLIFSSVRLIIEE